MQNCGQATLSNKYLCSRAISVNIDVNLFEFAVLALTVDKCPHLW